MKFNKTRIVFGIVTLYIVAAFGWWTYAHVLSNDRLYAMQHEQLELLCYKATLDVNGAIAQEIVDDSTKAHAYLEAKFPQLEIVFDENLSPLDNFLIRPKREAYAQLSHVHLRKKRMYLLEGVVMMSLLFWGIIWIYRNLNNRLKLQRQQGNFMLSITHELKTPLASIKLYLETLQKRTLTKEQTDTIVQNSLSDVIRLRDLVDNILLAAQLDTHKYEVQEFEVNLTELVERTVERFSLPRNLQTRLILNIEKEVYLTTDSTALEMVLSNLLSNALKYSPAEGKIGITLRTDDTQTVLSVADEGAGILDKEKETVFTKFYRTGDELTRKTKGTGLGLFIVKNLMHLLKGEIRIKDNKPVGTIFELSFKHHA